MTRFALIIDYPACWGCRTCEVACRQENRLSGGISLICVSEDGPRLAEGKPEFTYRVNTCRHCDQPDCVEACPEEAVTRRKDGIVVLDEEKCTGCGLCADQCLYDAIVVDKETGAAWKCNLCHNRVDHGLLPACADNVCPAHCIHFGDPDVIQKEIRKRRASCVTLPRYGPAPRKSITAGQAQ